MEREDRHAKFWLDPVRCQDSTGFGDAEPRKIGHLVEEHANQLRKAWDEHFKN